VLYSSLQYMRVGAVAGVVVLAAGVALIAALRWSGKPARTDAAAKEAV
jgi:hypothetical protein